MGGWKQKSGWIQIPPVSGVPFTFPFLSQPSVCLIVSRVRAYLTTDQQHGIPCFLKRGPLPDWPVWTRERMLSGAAAGGEGSQDEREREDSQTHRKHVLQTDNRFRSMPSKETERTRNRAPHSLALD